MAQRRAVRRLFIQGLDSARRVYQETSSPGERVQNVSLAETRVSLVSSPRSFISARVLVNTELASRASEQLALQEYTIDTPNFGDRHY